MRLVDADDTLAIRSFLDRDKADRLCIEFYEGKRSMKETLRIAKKYNNQVLGFVTHDLTQNEAVAA